MIKLSELKRIRKICFDKIARTALSKENLIVRFNFMNNSILEICLSNGDSYGRIILDCPQSKIHGDILMGWFDFVKICELFNKDINIEVKSTSIFISEGATKLICKKHVKKYDLACDFKFDFQNCLSLNTNETTMLDDHLSMQKYAIINDKLVSCDGSFCIINKLANDIGDEPILYVDRVPDGEWLISREKNLVVSKDKRISFIHKKATGKYPISIIKMSMQPLSNSFKCNSKELFEKIQQCALIYKVMDIKFDISGLELSSSGKSISKSEASYRTKIQATYNHKTLRAGFKFSIRYLIDFCKCTDTNGDVEIFFDDNPSVNMFRVESDKYIMFGMGMAN